jgi:chaperonin GroES
VQRNDRFAGRASILSPRLESVRAFASWESPAMQVRPLHDRILVQRLEEGEQQVGGIIIPDSAKEKPQRGTVIAAGDGRVTEEGTRVALDVKKGDTILFGKYSGSEIKFDGVDYLIMKEDEVLAIDVSGSSDAGKKR